MLVLKALLMMLTYDVLEHCGGLQTLHKTVRQWKISDTHASKNNLEAILKAVDYACVWYPKQTLCLQRSFVTTYLLRRAGTPAKMVLGATPNPFRAHAWVEVNGRPINENENITRLFAVWERC